MHTFGPLSLSASLAAMIEPTVSRRPQWVAAESVHAQLRGFELPSDSGKAAGVEIPVKADFREEKPKAASHYRPVEQRLADPNTEVQETIGRNEFLEEVSRCFSCGLCYGCENCFMYCNAGGFTKLEQIEPGTYFALSIDYCMGCGKCIDLCPSGYLTGE